VPPVIVLTAMCLPFGLQVEAAQSAKYPWQNRKSGVASGAPPARAVGGANARNMAATPDTTTATRLPCVARTDPPISSSRLKRVKLVANFCSFLNRVSQLAGFPASGAAHLAKVRNRRNLPVHRGFVEGRLTTRPRHCSALGQWRLSWHILSFERRGGDVDTA